MGEQVVMAAASLAAEQNCCGVTSQWSTQTNKGFGIHPSVFPLCKSEVWSSIFPCLHLLFQFFLLFPPNQLLLLKLGEDQAGQDSKNETLSSWDSI